MPPILGNIIVGALVLAIIALAIWGVIRNKKKGGGCGCAGCDKNGNCH